MKNKVMMVMSVVSVSLLAGAAELPGRVDDATIAFSTKGPDRYADGSVVLDGEVYALVWTSNGVFEGFNANGQPVDPNDKIVLAAPLAKGGCCPNVLFQIPADEAEAMKSGKYQVYLLDTRVTTGETVAPRMSEEGEITLMNGFTEVTSSIIASKNVNVEVSEKATTTSGGHVVSSVVKAPRDVQQPKVKGIRVEGDKVYLTVENLKGAVRAQGGQDVSASDFTTPATEGTGDGGDLILVAPKKTDSGFFRVIRN